MPFGNVTWQYPKGGDMLSKGMGMHLTISLGVPPNFFQAPNFFGLSKTHFQLQNRENTSLTALKSKKGHQNLF